MFLILLSFSRRKLKFIRSHVCACVVLVHLGEIMTNNNRPSSSPPCSYERLCRTSIVQIQQEGVGSRDKPVQCIDVLELFDKPTGLNWQIRFTALQKCLPVVVAYVLCGTDFTPTLYSLTSLSVFQAYHGYASNATNTSFANRGVLHRRKGGSKVSHTTVPNFYALRLWRTSVLLLDANAFLFCFLLFRCRNA